MQNFDSIKYVQKVVSISKLTIFLCVLLLSSVTTKVSYAAQEDSVRIFVDNVEVAPTDAQPFISDQGRVMVPIRAVSEAFQAKVDWDASKKQVIIKEDDFEVRFCVDGVKSGLDVVDVKHNTSKNIEMDSLPVVVNSRTFVPLRVISEAFEYKVDWNQESYRVDIATIPDKKSVSDNKYVSIYAHDDYNIAVKDDGTVWEWGMMPSVREQVYEPVKIEGLSNIKKATCYLALSNDGNVYIRTLPANQYIKAESVNNVKELYDDIYYKNGFVLKEDGSVWAIYPDKSPENIPEFNDIKKIDGNCILKNDGTVWYWCFDNPTGKFKILNQVAGLNNVVNISSKETILVSLQSDGTFLLYNDYPTLVPEYKTIKIKGLTDVIDFAIGNKMKPIRDGSVIGHIVAYDFYDFRYHIIALKKDGTVWGQGYNDYGQLGDGAISNDHSKEPVAVVEMKNVVAIAAGTKHSLVLKRDGSIWSWGRNNMGQLGRYGENSGIPVKLPNTGVKAPYLDSKNLALKKTAVSSGEEKPYLNAKNAVDSDSGSRWSSEYNDDSWIYVDLGQVSSINRVILNWEEAYGKAYKIQISDDAVKWSDVYSTSEGDGCIDDISLGNVRARYIKMSGIKRATEYGYSLFEFEVYNYN